MKRPRISWGYELKLLRMEYAISQSKAWRLMGEKSVHPLIVWENDMDGSTLNELGYQKRRQQFLQTVDPKRLKEEPVSV